MHIRTDSIDQSRFTLREQAGRTLVTRAKNLNYDYRPDELHLRSIVVDTATGEVVSSGFPKFFNFGEDTATDAVFRAATEIKVSPKHDGTLIIVSPQQDGSRIVRTRGQHDLGVFEAPVMALLDDDIGPPGFSYLFEYVSPANRIVVKHHESRLVPLAVVDHEDLSVRPLQEQETVAESAADLSQRVKGLSMATSGEGFVASTVDADGRLWLCKMKTQEYLGMHRLRFAMTPKRVRALVGWYQLMTRAQVRTLVEQDVGLDFECVDLEAADTALERNRQLSVCRRAFHAHCTDRGVMGNRAVAMAAKSFVEDTALQAALMHGEFHAQGLTTQDKAVAAARAYGANMKYRAMEKLIKG